MLPPFKDSIGRKLALSYRLQMQIYKLNTLINSDWLHAKSMTWASLSVNLHAKFGNIIINGKPSVRVQCHVAGKKMNIILHQCEGMKLCHQTMIILQKILKQKKQNTLFCLVYKEFLEETNHFPLKHSCNG